MGVRVFLQSRRPVSVAIRCGDMGGYPLHGTDPWGFTRTVGRATDRGGCHGGGRTGDDSTPQQRRK